MRQVFTSARIENVEGVARLLEDAGIEVRMTHGRSYRGAIRGNFSYRDSERAKQGPQAAVWVVRSADQPRARQMLREAGLLESTRPGQTSYLTASLHDRAPNVGGDRRQRHALRLKLGLLAVIAVAIVLSFLSMYGVREQAQAEQATAATAATSDPVFVVATPPALAETLLRIELAAQTPTLACLGIDGQAPPADLMTRLGGAQRRLVPFPDCPAGHDARYDVRGYRTDGSGVGAVTLELRHTSDAGEQHEIRVLEVQRRDDVWHVLRLLQGGSG